MGKWILLLLLCVGVIAEWIREIHTFRTTFYELHPPKLEAEKPRRLILLSDLHNCCYGKDNEKLLRSIREQKPDLILIAGDMLVGKKGAPTETACRFVKQLPAICPTCYANGNHEQRLKEDERRYGPVYRKYKAELQRAGVLYLENETASFTWGSCGVEVHGLALPDITCRKFRQAALPERCMRRCLGKADPSKYQILIAHNPAFMSDYLRWGADLVVSGHLHGGIVRIPFWRGVFSPQGGLFPKYSGEMTKIGDAAAVVSRGLGLHTIRFRFFNPAEVVVLQIGGSTKDGNTGKIGSV